MAKGGIPDLLPLHVHVFAEAKKKMKSKRKTDHYNTLIILGYIFLKKCTYCLFKSVQGSLLPAIRQVCFYMLLYFHLCKIKHCYFKLWGFFCVKQLR